MYYNDIKISGRCPTNSIMDTMEKISLAHLRRILSAAQDRVFLGPERLEIELITSCNMNCLFCWFHSPFCKVQQKKWKLELKKFKEVISDASSLGCRYVYLTGRGEPLLHPDIGKMVLFAKTKGMRIVLTTNLSCASSRVLESLVFADQLEVTLCAFQEKAYGALHCPRSENRFKHVIRNIKTLQKKVGSRIGTFFLLNFIVNRHNYRDISSFVSLAEGLKIPQVRFSAFSYTPETRHLCLNKAELDGVRREIERLTLASPVQISNTLSLQTPARIKSCYMGWFTLLLGVYGGVRVGCFDPPFPEAGNIYKNSLKKIWFSKKAQKIRTDMKYHLEKYGKSSHCPFFYRNLEVEKKMRQFF